LKTSEQKTRSYKKLNLLKIKVCYTILCKKKEPLSQMLPYNIHMMVHAGHNKLCPAYGG